MTDGSVALGVVRVIIVGAGFAGLGCAIECKRKGHDVVVLEKVGTFKTLGETHSFGLRRCSISLMPCHRLLTGDVRLSSVPRLPHDASVINALSRSSVSGGTSVISSLVGAFMMSTCLV